MRDRKVALPYGKDDCTDDGDEDLTKIAIKRTGKSKSTRDEQGIAVSLHVQLLDVRAGGTVFMRLSLGNYTTHAYLSCAQ
eukprot:3622097-Amphidinium_carterae.1